MKERLPTTAILNRSNKIGPKKSTEQHGQVGHAKSRPEPTSEPDFLRTGPKVRFEVQEIPGRDRWSGSASGKIYILRTCPGRVRTGTGPIEITINFSLTS